MKKITIMIIMMLILPTAMAGTMKIYPSDDAFVRDRSPNQNFGVGSWEEDLRVGYNTNFGTDRSYVKFDISSLNGKTINSIIFSIDPAGYQGNPTLNLNYVSNNNWNEETITWNNCPQYTTIIDSKNVDDLGRIEFDINPSFSDGEEFSFVMIEQGEDAEVVFDSKDYDTGCEEDYMKWPYLEVNYNGGSIECPSSDYSNVCCSLTGIEMMGFINAFNRFETMYTGIEMMDFINKFNRFEVLC
ncbi:MAG: DNRLRE domain-containing protein [Nanoarchaeota archaeon]|nr:DNRLRE domain-containing protein [Nanoarchaeota archaeon]